ncbi:hypothetical protein RUM44_011828 [Polyplax serrata]|uniref:Menorin-like domain-containing protein n=1 Tax=Polyplax serrata TaxID=468196 RepID=A0ABR1BDK3_POLSC
MTWFGSAADMTTSTTIPDVQDYFPELGGDLTKVVWAHAVNSRHLLEDALTDAKVMMLEADVVLGTLSGQNITVPIMAHPPATVSDISLQMFLDTVIDAQTTMRKGVKLDFKSIESFNMSWNVLEPLKTKVNFPLFLNADIIIGPVNSTIRPVDPKQFLFLSTTKLMGCTLSVGWTTRYGPGIVGYYTNDQLNEMKLVIENNKVIQPVTLCVRAGLAAQTDGIESLVRSIDEYQGKNSTSVTVWMSTNSDPVDLNKLKKLVNNLGRRRVYLDVPKFVHDQIIPDANDCLTWGNSK